ncbi:immunoglobulin lambda-1 light chain-like [Rhinoderma darwinii]|uniref:immunoglobulin lambda-1 light chain-like n=1 Tax=Rhinoderma darwinii TaxID=43563 RepID=UPI003F662C2D
MSWTVLLLIASYCSYCAAQFTVIQDDTTSVTPGKSIRLTCSQSGGSVAPGNHPTWIYQSMGSVPKLIVSSDGSSNHNVKPPGASTRFTGSISGGSAVLSISNVQSEDDGEYYCTLYSGGLWVFGDGTQLTALTGDVKAPSVSIYGPSEDELKTDKATIVCIMGDFTPRIASVEWTVDGSKWTTGVQSSPVSKQADNLYMGSSFLSLSSSDFTKHEEYSCKVTHQGKEIIQTLKRSECS